MTTVTANKIIGEPVDRIDGTLKVTGAATYPSDVTYPGMAYAVLVGSTIAVGRIRAIDTVDALAAPGVLTVLTHENIPSLPDAPASPFGPPPRFPLRDDRVLHQGQHVAVVVAESPEQARNAARFVRVDYEETVPVLAIDDPAAPIRSNPFGTDAEHGDVIAALASAEVGYEETFRTAPVTNNPLGLFATVACWDDERLVVHESTQWPMQARRTLAGVFSLAETAVRVLVPHLGGAFGAGLRTWPHTILTALAARLLDRPVKLVLTRPQMFTAVGHRPESVQRVRLGATREGRLVAIDHEGTAPVAAEEFTFDRMTTGTPDAYDCPNVAVRDRLVALNIPNPGFMRAPGHAEGSFALESAMDELAFRLGIDPVELRLRNFAGTHPRTGLPWSSNALRECYRLGAERFGWYVRDPVPRSMRDGEWLVGCGMAGVTYQWYVTPCQVRISIGRDGTARVACAGTDIGTGTYTITAQLAAEMLGLDVEQVHVELGDSDLPPAPQSGGSGLATSLAGAVEDGTRRLLDAFLDLVGTDDRSPLRGRTRREVTANAGRLHLVSDPDAGEPYAHMLARHDLDELTVIGEKIPDPQAPGLDMAPSGASAAQFVEVRVHEELGMLRVSRLLSVMDAGTVLNEKTARSQVSGALVMGIGMAMLEETVFDPATGRITNGTFADYLIPTHADIPDVDVVFVGEPDRVNPLGAKGLGEVGLVGLPAAVANAVHHATGKRIRSLPITIEKLF
ncbi:xanthine dehydrogenase family protein molybdopterin-binding subunit [Pseudonocardia adelaidensis]|uniref:Xanthine dehydrogenase family protein molybdopterin-binding subunit n=1 Tax=Pseudonocardia adelaidensis TaxID=648754 RepID=A0ABP9NS32_9PSEU